MLLATSAARRPALAASSRRSAPCAPTSSSSPTSTATWPVVRSPPCRRSSATAQLASISRTLPRPDERGEPSGFDLDDDGLHHRPHDAFGWGRFPGNGAMALLSAASVDAAAARTFRGLLCPALPVPGSPRARTGAPGPTGGGRRRSGSPPGPTGTAPSCRPAAACTSSPPIRLRRSSTARAPQPPAQSRRDGLLERLPRRNGLARLPAAAPPARPRLRWRSSARPDPVDAPAIPHASPAARQPRGCSDPRPRVPARAARAAARRRRPRRPPRPRHRPLARRRRGPGNLRVDYVLPARGSPLPRRRLRPAPALAAEAAAASAHRLVSVDDRAALTLRPRGDTARPPEQSPGEEVLMSTPHPPDPARPPHRPGVHGGEVRKRSSTGSARTCGLAFGG